MLAELENISYYVQTPGHNKRFSGHNSGGIHLFKRFSPRSSLKKKKGGEFQVQI